MHRRDVEDGRAALGRRRHREELEDEARPVALEDRLDDRLDDAHDLPVADDALGGDLGRRRPAVDPGRPREDRDLLGEVEVVLQARVEPGDVDRGGRDEAVRAGRLLAAARAVVEPYEARHLAAHAVAAVRRDREVGDELRELEAAGRALAPATERHVLLERAAERGERDPARSAHFALNRTFWSRGSAPPSRL